MPRIALARPPGTASPSVRALPPIGSAGPVPPEDRRCGDASEASAAS